MCKRRNSFISLISIIILGGVYFVYGIVPACGEDFYQVNATQSVSCTGPLENGSTLCQKVTNNGSKALLVPVKRWREWQAFRDSHPSWVTLSPCGCNGVTTMTVAHSAGTVAPVSKTVVYGIEATDIAGSGNKCWITQNLGADRHATIVRDATEASGGWYWQFNRKQGYMHDGANRVPNTAWDSAVSEDSDWTPANDPCSLLLGLGWRMPTAAEWTNADSGWSTYIDGYNSALILHPAGRLETSGALRYRGDLGFQWSSTQRGSAFPTLGYGLYYMSVTSSMTMPWKSEGQSVRCLKDI